jgi:hypothetical protein
VVVKNEVISVGICDACGEDIRAGSLYCYNCGGKVIVDEVKAGTAASANLIKPERNGTSAARVEDSIVDSTSVPRPGSRNMRRPERGRVHVVWETTDGPGYLLLIFAVIVALIVVGMLAAAIYLK